MTKKSSHCKNSTILKTLCVTLLGVAWMASYAQAQNAVSPSEVSQSADENQLLTTLGKAFGIVVVPTTQGYLVKDVSTGSAADKSGIKTGEIIIKVNGINTAGLSIMELLAKTMSQKSSQKDPNCPLEIQAKDGTVRSVSLDTTNFKTSLTINTGD